MLEVKKLQITFGKHVAVHEIDFLIKRGESLAIVGESGSGKSVSALSILGLLPKNATVEGEILFEGQNVCKMNNSQLQKLRGKKIAMVFQEPMTSLNPVFSIGEQIMETILAHESISRSGAKCRTLLALEEVGIPTSRFKSFPHEFSGGMRQRVVIAIALACTPDVLIADEPTTALDASTSLQIIDLLKRLQQDRGHGDHIYYARSLPCSLNSRSDMCDAIRKNCRARRNFERSQYAHTHIYKSSYCLCAIDLHKT